MKPLAQISYGPIAMSGDRFKRGHAVECAASRLLQTIAYLCTQIRSYRSFYLQYKHNTSILLKWIVTTASAVASDVSVRPKNNYSKNKKKAARATRAAQENLASPEVTFTGLLSLSNIIAEAQEAVPDGISALFDSVIRARTVAYQCYQKLWTDNPDEDLKQSSEAHKPFIDALKSAWDTLSGAAWREKYPDGKKYTKKAGGGATDIAKSTENPQAVYFMNAFEKLDIEVLPSEDEAELEDIANSEVYFAVCFFIRDFLDLRRYMFDLWHQVGQGKVHCTAALAQTDELESDLVSASNERSLITPERMRQWKSDYTISWLYDLVNTYTARRLSGLKSSTPLENAEKLDWSFTPFKTEWTNREVWGPMEFVKDITVLAMQKPESLILHELKPHHVFQLQLVVDSMLKAKRWAAAVNTPPIDRYGATHPTFIWDNYNDLREVRAVRNRWVNSPELLIKMFKEDTDRQGDAGLWNAPISHLDVSTTGAQSCGDTNSSLSDPSNRLPTSMFAQSSASGLWIYSPYLCGTGQAKLLNMVYDWGTKCWDRPEFMVGFFHLCTKSSYFAKFNTKRRGKGGKVAESALLRQKGRSNQHSLFKNASKLYALGEACYKKSKLDLQQFPSLATQPRNVVEFLDRIKTDLVSDFGGTPPVVFLNYGGIFTIVMVLLQTLEEATQDLPSVKRRIAEEFVKYNKMEFGLHDKVYGLAFGTSEIMIQDTAGHRLDHEILCRMDFVLEETWIEIELELMPALMLNDLSKEADYKPKRGTYKNAAVSPAGRFLLEEQLASVGDVNPEAYAMVKSLLEQQQYGDCADCLDWQAGVKLEAGLGEKLKQALLSGTLALNSAVAKMAYAVVTTKRRSHSAQKASNLSAYFATDTRVDCLCLSAIFMGHTSRLRESLAVYVEMNGIFDNAINFLNWRRNTPSVSDYPKTQTFLNATYSRFRVHSQKTWLSSCSWLLELRASHGRWYHQSQIKNGLLIIDGGVESFSDRGPGRNQYDDPNWQGLITMGPNYYTLAINISTSWDWKLNMSEVIINKTADAQTGNYPPLVEAATIFQGPPDDPQIYLYGGVTSTVNWTFPKLQLPLSSQYTLWSLDPTTDVWSQHDVFSEVPERPSRGAYAEAPDKGLAFYLNGEITNESSINSYWLGNRTMVLEGMARNFSTVAITNDLPRIRGGMIYVPALGPQGVLVTIGGATAGSTGLNLLPMNQVNVFDVSAATNSVVMGDSGGWYTQSLTGTVPEPRVDFCLVLASAPDNTSHSIYMYGGWDPTQENKYFDETWVLTLPSFTWILVNSGSLPRYGHTCHFAGSRQMLTIGGQDTTDLTASCDWEYMGIAVFDLTSLVWGSVFSSSKPAYQLPSQIYNIVGGGADGNASKMRPEGGWTTVDIASLFTGSENQTAEANLTALAVTGTVVNGTGTNITTMPTMLPPPGGNTGVSAASQKSMLVGGVVAAIVAFLLFISLIITLRRQNPKFFSFLSRNKKQEGKETGDVEEEREEEEVVGDRGWGIPLPEGVPEAGGDVRCEVHGVMQLEARELYGVQMEVVEMPGEGNWI
ncbi:hypothetical protein G7Y89_g847 [Cudoniella acicularis]|uniref:DUF6604 domain-containing protein n=1 Tax=Cudoniella acicularis TaxID=354080 RepID=A0A8H4RY48_9HELO|nr:hypothetical protein G7Y89_g847 [Cudoniella acicularis]